MERIGAQIKHLMKEMEPAFIEIFQRLHKNPELSFQEYETTRFIKERLLNLGIELQDIGMETGVVGILRGGSEGPCIGLRADIDGLPIQEISTSDYPSENPGVMHACGHDTHMASLLSAAEILAVMKDSIHGSVKFIFQPAEELNLGAKKMIASGCMENPKVEAIFGMHNASDVPVGSMGVKLGPLMASVDRIEITITGKGGHGGVPQRSVDPIVAAAAVIQSLQTIVSRNVSPIDSCVVSICNVKAGEGTINNVIPDEVNMYGTVRNYTNRFRKTVEGRIRSIVEHVSAAYGGKGELNYIYELNVVDNEKNMYQAARNAVAGISVPGIDPIPSTGGEDFSEFMSEAPGFMYWLGVRNEEKDCIYPWHSPRFKADEKAISVGAGVYAASVFSAIEMLRNG